MKSPDEAGPVAAMAKGVLLFLCCVLCVQICDAPRSSTVELKYRFLVRGVGKHRLVLPDRKIAAGPECLGCFGIELIACRKVESAREDRDAFSSRVGMHTYCRLRRELETHYERPR